VRAIGIRFLWVDALCIIQDGERDKNSEISRMMGVYENASLVLAATSSSGSRESFLRPGVPTERLSFRFPARVAGHHTSIEVLSSLARHEKSEMGDGGSKNQDDEEEFDYISKRAWCRQECALGRRLVVYTRRGVFFHCRRTSRRNSQPCDAGHHDAYVPSLVRINITIRRLTEMEFSGDWLRAWFQVLEDYTARGLSDLADSGTALDGLSRRLAAQTKQVFLFGMWERFLPDCLLWCSSSYYTPRWPTPPAGREPPRIAPTWSWINCRNPVMMLNLSELFNPQFTILPQSESTTS